MEQRQALKSAVAAIESGDHVAGRLMLVQVLRADPTCSEAWLWLSRIAESDAERQECLRRALSPREASPFTPPFGPRTGELPGEFSSSSLTPASAVLPPVRDADGTAAATQMATRMRPRDDLPPLGEEQRRSGQRNAMVAGAMSLSLLCGVVLLVFLVLTLVPAAHERMRQRYTSTPYRAVLWCPSCDRSDEPIVLRERPRRILSGRAGTLYHGTTVTVVAEEWAKLEGCLYVRVQTATERGWVRATYVRP